MDRATRTAITDRAAIMERRATTTPRATSANMVSTPATATTSTTIRAAWAPAAPFDLFATGGNEGGNLESAKASDRFGPALDIGLPDGHDPLDFVHHPFARGERLHPVASRACDGDGIAADRDATETVDDGHRRNPELFLRLLRERGQALDRHRPIDFVVEGSDPFVGTHGADEEDDRTGVVPPHAVEDGFQVDPRPAHVNHPAPPLTGGRSATSSPSFRTRSGETMASFTASNMEPRWSASRGYFATMPSTSSRRVMPSRADHVRPRDPTISR